MVDNFFSAAAEDSARVHAIFKAADTDGDGSLSRNEFTEFLRKVQPDYLQPDGQLSNEDWCIECQNLGAGDRIDFQAFERLYSYFGRSTALDYAAAVPVQQVRAAQDEPVPVRELITDAEAKGGHTLLQKLTANFEKIEGCAMQIDSASSVLTEGRALRAALANLQSIRPDIERVYMRAGGNGCEAIYGETAARQAYNLHDRFTSLFDDLSDRVSSSAAVFATAESIEQAAAKQEATARRLAEQEKRKREEQQQVAAAEQRALLELNKRQEAERSEEDRAMVLRDLHSRAEAVRRKRGQAPTGCRDEFRKGRWKSYPLGQEPGVDLDIELALKLQSDSEKQMVALRESIESIREDDSTRAAKRKCLGVLVMFCDNILKQPRSRSFRKIRMRNDRFVYDVLCITGAKDALIALGFEQELWWGGMAGEHDDDQADINEQPSQSFEGEQFLVMNEVNLDHISASRRLLEELRSVT